VAIHTKHREPLFQWARERAKADGALNVANRSIASCVIVAIFDFFVITSTGNLTMKMCCPARRLSTHRPGAVESESFTDSTNPFLINQPQIYDFI
jgi:hypothetical protein